MCHKKKEWKTEYTETLIKEFECEECKRNFQGTEAEEHMEKHLRSIIKSENMKDEKQEGKALGVTGMLMKKNVVIILDESQ